MDYRIYRCVSDQININENKVKKKKKTFLKKILPVFTSERLNTQHPDHQGRPKTGFSRIGSVRLLSSRNKESPRHPALNLYCPISVCTVGQVVHCTVGLGERVREAENQPTCCVCEGACPGLGRVHWEEGLPSSSSSAQRGCHF